MGISPCKIKTAAALAALVLLMPDEAEARKPTAEETKWINEGLEELENFSPQMAQKLRADVEKRNSEGWTGTPR